MSSRLSRPRLIGCVAAWVIAAAAIAGPARAAAATPPACGDVVTGDVRLTSDLVCPDTGLVVGADAIVIDLNGHSIEGPGNFAGSTTVGIDDGGGYDRVRIVDGTVTRFGTGIRFEDVRHSTIRNASATLNGQGILLVGSDGNTIRRSEVISSGFSIRVGDGIRLESGSDRNRLIRNLVDNNEEWGVRVLGSDGNLVARNRLTANGAGASTIFSAKGSVFARNSGGNRFVGLELGESADTWIVGNQFPTDGFYLNGSETHVLGNVAGGFRASGPGLKVIGNVAEFTPFEDTGILIDAGSEGALLERNVSNGHLDDGIGVQSPGVVIADNTANDNLDLGIEAVPGVIDGGGNRASGNRNPLQCLNVVCG
jgi:parallel beta-helix repeat protein